MSKSESTIKMLHLAAQAEKLSHKSSMQFKHACIIATSHGRILSQAINTPGEKGIQTSFHAEYNAFRRIRKGPCGQGARCVHC